jgi:hypothetical protein
MSDRKVKIDSYGRAHEKLAAALPRFPRNMWQFRPAPDEWTIHEIIIHIADSEANSYIRCRRFLAEPGESLMAYDEGRWAKSLHYHDQSPEHALELFRWLRKQSFDLIVNAPEEVWSRQCFHPESGMMTMENWLDIYERHVPEHVRQMKGVHQAWVAGPGGKPAASESGG